LRAEQPSVPRGFVPTESELVYQPRISCLETIGFQALARSFRQWYAATLADRLEKHRAKLAIDPAGIVL